MSQRVLRKADRLLQEFVDFYHEVNDLNKEDFEKKFHSLIEKTNRFLQNDETLELPTLGLLRGEISPELLEIPEFNEQETTGN